ncbi:hypothetical protein RHECIAT_CH0002765 [Rhizobium etli CIAT 652]|uniref:Uncharacterized protein n=1 Tax=Rhizobium etli (strain CIAT 652) TaxID=491916 RepID=B3PSL8_RHIE6|nr:hypothetical protein RHECIAT_CH0002765 [Rhizobium etli CIAT 652]
MRPIERILDHRHSNIRGKALGMSKEMRLRRSAVRLRYRSDLVADCHCLACRADTHACAIFLEEKIDPMSDRQRLVRP